MHQAQIDTESTRPDGTTLRGWIRVPGTASPGRGIWIAHGLGEHLGRHDAFVQWLLERGWTVGGHDHRGHGRSGGRRAGLERRDDLLDDLKAGLDRFAEHLESPPLLFGQSLGGLVALLLALRSPERVRGLILSSPTLDPGLPIWQRALHRILIRLAPNMPVPSGLSPQHRSHDPEVAKRWREDPLVHGLITPRLLDFIIVGAHQALRQARGLSVPTLLQFGTEDRFVEVRGTRRFGYTAPRSMLTVIEYPWLRHELHHEPPALREPVLDDLERWLARFG
jgi:alpha-beta hydrolase superfamily lysophospholipase